ncbi:MAG: DUF4115 domain-containing protein, partial [Mailhella sp.]|nr:DUF4115 domain-containing protein [Mailhella sp.]
MTLAELGAKLREAREARGMTVADAADRLKIPGRILHGVEEASDRLPRTVYVHHFIKDYIKLLGFTAAEAKEWTSSLEGFENIARPALSESQPFTSVKPSMLPVVLSGLFKVAVTAVLAFAVYSAYVYFFAGRDYEEVKPPEQAQPAPASAPAEAPAVTQAMPSASEDALPQSSASLVSQMMPSGPAEEPAAPEKQAGEQGEEQGGAQPAALPEGMHHVEVIADGGDCWMGFEPDGHKQQRTLRKGDSFTMTFRDSLQVKLGHASAVRVIYDGRELERSTSQRVMTLRFP